MKGTIWGFHDGFGFRSMLIEFQVFYDRGVGKIYLTLAISDNFPCGLMGVSFLGLL